MIGKKGISLIVTVIAIIIMIIVAGAVILTLTNTNIIDQADSATKNYNKQQYKTMIGNEFAILRTSEEAKGKTLKELFEMLEVRMNIKELAWTATSKMAYINVNDEYFLTLLADGTIKEGKVAILDIADGSIDLKSNGYIQGKLEYSGNAAIGYKVIGDFVEYTGDYIITGTTTENIVKVVEEGTYNIIIKDLNIDTSATNDKCPFYMNAGRKPTGCFVNLYIEGNNKIYAGPGSTAISFPKATPNVDGITNGSTLTIQGDGNLHAIGGSYAAGIGAGYGNNSAGAGEVANIIINSGNIKAEGKSTGIGGSNNGRLNNLIINGGNIVAQGTAGIGTPSGTSDNIFINGGNITSIGGEYGSTIGSNGGCGRIQITGGVLNLSNNYGGIQSYYSLLGNQCLLIEISGGTINGSLEKETAIGTAKVTENINITGGSVYMNRRDNLYAVPPKSGDTNVYLTEIELKDVLQEIQVTSFKTSDNLTYGIKDMYTTSEGKIFVYLPTGERTINITAGGKEYTGIVETTETDATECVVLNEK